MEKEKNKNVLWSLQRCFKFIITKGMMMRKKKIISTKEYEYVLKQKDALLSESSKLIEELWTIKKEIDPLGEIKSPADMIEKIKTLKEINDMEIDVGWLEFIMEQPLVRDYIKNKEYNKLALAITKRTIKKEAKRISR